MSMVIDDFLGPLSSIKKIQFKLQIILKIFFYKFLLKKIAQFDIREDFFKIRKALWILKKPLEISHRVFFFFFLGTNEKYFKTNEWFESSSRDLKWAPQKIINEY